MKTFQKRIGRWVTIRGTAVFIEEGETIGAAFQRTTGKSLGGPTAKTAGPDYTGKLIGTDKKQSAGTVVVKSPKTKYKGDTPTIAAARIRQMSTNDDKFIENVRAYAVSNVRPTGKENWTVQKAQPALDSGTGDCSEQAQIMAEMLQSQGIDAKVVHGDVPGYGLHDTVEIKRNGTVTIIDAKQFPKFKKIGDGLHPKERLME